MQLNFNFGNFLFHASNNFTASLLAIVKSNSKSSPSVNAGDKRRFGGGILPSREILPRVKREPPISKFPRQFCSHSYMLQISGQPVA